jgi:hypothetical protein
VSDLLVGEPLTASTSTVTMQGLFFGLTQFGEVRVDFGHTMRVLDDQWTIRDVEGVEVVADTDSPPPDLE